MDEVRGLMDFLDRAPTAYQAVADIAAQLDAAGFASLSERGSWALVPGGKYYFTRNQSSIIAFRIPEQGFAHFQIVASHCDSPAFKLKPNAARDGQGYAMLNVEKYGGMLMQTWFDRPLGIAGRIIVHEDGRLITKLVDCGRNLALIPNMPIHFNRKANEGVELNAQVDMMPVIGAEGADVMDAVAAAAGVDKEAIAGADLFLVNTEKAARWGVNSEYIASGRLDDLECAYASVRALLTAGPSKHIDMACVFDDEEVGSGTKQGADSTMLTDALSRIAAALGADAQALSAAVSGSFMLSADNAHAVHPNHPEKYDAENRTRMNGGVVVKFNANQKYTTDGVSAAVFETILKRAGVPSQRYANRSDVPGGGTLGHIANAHASMNTADIGLAQLAMHSAYESAGAEDVDHMISGMRAFHQTEIDVLSDGEIRLG